MRKSIFVLNASGEHSRQGFNYFLKWQNIIEPSAEKAMFSQGSVSQQNVIGQSLLFLAVVRLKFKQFEQGKYAKENSTSEINSGLGTSVCVRNES